MARVETIAAFFGKDHDEIEALLAAVDFADPIQAFPRAAEDGAIDGDPRPSRPQGGSRPLSGEVEKIVD